ncbi:TPA: bifunctional precorrin-2 dehydrogenase/sirohydrochlorin ferrochelatase [Salmonella enterica subsp. enterica serovar Eastbourne]|uniref:precorrin-2 dehydrogenase n=1 Tax=Salmonella enterica subsp. enterica serovar Eastbourne TaxID=486993 RepID=A0A702B7X7_SALET|nr:hypothetical protein [Salmonella enterica]ECA1898239.1 hypothetical protein [Salmonella enterica subsp. enterica serovar Eastbourne]HAC6678802.1 hypothetical protein [Salmonella enterica subsp. enterica serovar Eastbourne]HAE5116287.1 hypothetical protein [Salmonella enterica subsp. enterica serovar Eastbourne]HAE8030666.1 hypothetical protein [Salmonella enterica subsp. enterica serovar Eastbourne]
MDYFPIFCNLKGKRCLIVGGWQVATSDQKVNRQVAGPASAERIFCNVVDDLSVATFISPAIIDHSPVIIALSCGGCAPVYSKILKTHVAARLPPGIRESVRLAGALRERVNGACSDRERMRAFWAAFFRHVPLQQALAQEHEQEVKQQVEWLIQHRLLSE